MNLPSIIPETGGSHARGKQGAPPNLKTRHDRTGFDAVLSDLHVKATGPASRTLLSHAPNPRDVATAKTAVSAPNARDGTDAQHAPTLLDVLTASNSTREQTHPEARDVSASGASAMEDHGVDKLLKRVGSGDDAPTETSTATLPQDPTLSLVSPGAGSQMMPSPLLAAPERISLSSLPLEVPDKIASAASQPVDDALKQPSIFDVSVASQLAPTGPAPPNAQIEASSVASATAEIDQAPDPHRPAGKPSAPLLPAPQVEADSESIGEATAAYEGSTFTGKATVGKETSSSGGLSRPSSGATVSAAAAIIAASPPAPEAQSDRAPSSRLERPLQQSNGADAEAPRTDDTPSLDVTNPPQIEVPANGLPTLSPAARQVAVALTRLAAETSVPSSAAPVHDMSPPRPAVARTLTLQISPAALGTVAVRMHATGSTLDVRLTASDPQTAGLLSRERDALTASLQDRHATVLSLVIQDGSGGPQPGGHHATQGDTFGAEPQTRQRGGGAGSDGERSQRHEQPAGEARRDDTSDGDRRRPQNQRVGAGRSLLV